MFNDLIFDRTKNDVENKNEKSFWNLNDIDRINKYLKLLANEIEINLVIEEFTIGEYITKNKIDKLLDCVEEVRKNWYVAKDTPLTPNTAFFDFKKANNVEKIIYDLSWFVYSYKNDKIFSGILRAGEFNL